MVIVAAVSYPLGLLPGLGWWRLDFNLVEQGAICLSLILMVVWTVDAVIRRKPHGIPMLVGFGVLMASVISDVTGLVLATNADFGFRATELGTLILQLCCAFIIGQHILASEKSLERANARALVAHEQERNRLARDIHDGIGQWLSTIKLNLQILQSRASAGQPVQHGRLGEPVADVDATIEDTRRIAHDLSPAFLEQHGLVAAMQSHVDRAIGKNGPTITVDAPAALSLPETVRNHFYRIFQKALANALAHSDASHITISLTATGRRAELRVLDNGDGTVSDVMKECHGLGLSAMAQRAELLGGTFRMISEPARGTTIIVDVPLRAA